MSWFWAWNFANTLSVNDVIFAKRLTDITPYTDYIEKLTAIFAPDELDDIDTLPEINYPAYSSTNFLSDVYMTRHDYDTLVDVLKMKKNIILQGAPGVGKTFTAKRLAYSIIGSKNPERVQMIQFHQSYSLLKDTAQQKTDLQLRKALFTNSVNWPRKMMKMIISLSLMKLIVAI